MTLFLVHQTDHNTTARAIQAFESTLLISYQVLIEDKISPGTTQVAPPLPYAFRPQSPIHLTMNE